MSDDIAISVQNVSKAYRIWRDPSARLKAPLWDAIGKLVPKFVINLNAKLKLRAGNSGRYYKDFYALKDISFEVKKGEAVGIIGRNGSGKSTLLQMIAGTLTPTVGNIKVNGRIAALLELGSGFNPDFTGRENVFINGAVLAVNRKIMEEKYQSIIEFADIGDFIDQPIKTYSSGMVVRLAFAVQTAINPEILIVDEALAVGDEAFQQKCFSRLRDLRKNGTTLLFVSHDAGSIIAMCDRCVVLDQGNVKMIDSPRVCINHYHKLIYSGDASAKPVDNPSILFENDEQQTYYDPSLQSNSTIELGTGDCEIYDVRIENSSDRKANIIHEGSDFKVKYRVRFLRPTVGILYSATIKTLKGVPLASLKSHKAPEYCPEPAQKGIAVMVEFAVENRLIPGTYIVEIGVRGFNNGIHQLLGAINDCVLVKIIPIGVAWHTGHVNLFKGFKMGKVENDNLSR